MALGDIGTGGDDCVVPALIETLGDPARFVREQAAWALGKLGKEAEPAVDRLTKAVEDRIIPLIRVPPPVWALWKIALWKIIGDSPRVNVVLEEFRDPPYRGKAAPPLSDFGDEAPSALPQLREWAETGDQELRQAAHALLEDFQIDEPPVNEPPQSTGDDGS